MLNWLSSLDADKPTIKVSRVLQLRHDHTIFETPVIKDFALARMFYLPVIDQVCYWHIRRVRQVDNLRFMQFRLHFNFLFLVIEFLQ